jgi:DNA processing protein
LLELPDRELIEAVGGRRRAELNAAWTAWDRARAKDATSQSVCRHHPSYPERLREDPLAPRALQVRGGLERLTSMLEGKLVAIVGTRRASDYGVDTARELARGLTASGVVVAGELAEGIAAAALAGALDAGGPALAACTGGLGRCSPASCEPLHERVVASGCAISERPAEQRPRRWWQLGCARTLALLADLVIVVEAGERPSELACAQVASSRDRQVGAVPGRVSSPASRGTNSLLIAGAKLIRDTADALDALHGVNGHALVEHRDEPPWLEPRLREVLERVGRGEDTVEKLVSHRHQAGAVVSALTELELDGRLRRGDGGRYLPSARQPPRCQERAAVRQSPADPSAPR